MNTQKCIHDAEGSGITANELSDVIYSSLDNQPWASGSKVIIQVRDENTGELHRAEADVVTHQKEKLHTGEILSEVIVTGFLNYERHIARKAMLEAFKYIQAKTNAADWRADREWADPEWFRDVVDRLEQVVRKEMEDA